MRYLMLVTALVGAFVAISPAASLAQDGESDPEAGPPPAVTTWSGVRVETTEGWAFRGVTLHVDEAAGTALMVRPDGAERTIPLAQIAAVFSAEGENITTQVLAEESASLGAPMKPGYGEIGGTAGAVASSHRSGAWDRSVPRLFSVAPSFGFGYGFPLGGFYEGMDSGLSFHVGLKAMISDLSFVDFVFRTTNIFSQSFAFVDQYGGPMSIEVDLDVRQYLVMFGTMGRPAENSLTRGYFEAGVGWADHAASGSAGGASASESVGRFVLAMQGGLFVPFGESGVGLDFSVHTLAKFIGKEPGEEAGFIFGGQVGFVVFVGGD